MTLLEMIKKYEKMKEDMETKYVGRTMGNEAIETVGRILDDLHSILQPSMIDIRSRVLKKMNAELGYEHYDDVQTLAHVLQMLPE